jgi:hypothetical protein
MLESAPRGAEVVGHKLVFIVGLNLLNDCASLFFPDDSLGS